MLGQAASVTSRMQHLSVCYCDELPFGTCRMSFLKPFACPPAADIETCCCEPESRHHTAHNQISKVIDNMNTAAVTNEATIPNRTAFVVDIKLPPWKWQWAPATENVRCN